MHLESEATSLRNKTCSKICVITIDERTCIALIINHTEINSVTATEW